jgi:hypothetical protein
MPTYKVLYLEDYSLVEYKVYRSTVTGKDCRLHFRAISRIPKLEANSSETPEIFSYTFTAAD